MCAKSEMMTLIVLLYATVKIASPLLIPTLLYQLSTVLQLF